MSALLSAPAGPGVAAVQAALVAGFLLVLGWLVADALLGARVDGVSAWGLAFAGLCLYTVAIMIVHMASGGRVFSSPWLVRTITVGTLVVLGALRALRRRRATATGSGRSALVAAALALVAAVVWGYPLARVLPVSYGGDTSLHAGWASQLLNGESTPSAAITGPIPNFYPWLFHSLSALVTQFTPGGRIWHSLAPVQLLQSVGAVLALFGLGRALTGRTVTGVAAALFGGLTGGVGFVLLRGLDLAMDPRTEGMRYLGDLLFKRSYNASFYNLAPPFPRDVAYSLLVAALLLVAIGTRERSPALLAGAGTVVGLAGLAGAESFFVGLGIAAVGALGSTGTGRGRAAAALLLPALGVYALWLVPQVLSYVRLGGYVNLTVVGPVTLPPHAILVSWGVVTPLAVAGAVRFVPQVARHHGARLAAVTTLVGGAVLAASVAVPEVFGRAFTSLGRPHRYWPLLYLGLALFAALGASWLFDRLRTRSLAPGLLAALVAAVALASPVVASLALPAERARSGLLHDAVRGDADNLLNLVAPTPGGRCRAAVPLSFDTTVWAYTGYRLVAYTWGNPHPGNEARIRWRDIYEVVTPLPQRLRDNRILTLGRGPRARWRAIAGRYGVDVVVAPTARASSQAFAGLRGTPSDSGAFTVFRLSDCGHPSSEARTRTSEARTRT